MTAGSIVRLQLKHFMAYDYAEITPSPGLNLITGPNGTGKSSLLCAMCLGLAGKPSSIGRSERISDFIKHGYDQASIEIELLNPGAENVVIGRLISSSNNSQWTLNGKTSSQKMVERELSRFNIQTNNLCQFLPQEKVSDFTKMNQKELLESTEQAVGNQAMFEDHVKLKQLRSEYCDLENNIKNTQENLDREVEKNQRLEAEVQQHKERQKYTERIERLRKKIPWVKYNNAHNEYMAGKDEKKRLTLRHKESARKLDPVKEQLQQINQELSQIAKDIGSQDEEIRKKKQEISSSMLKLEEVDSKVADLTYEVNGKIEEESQRDANLTNAKRVLQNLETEYRVAQVEDASTQKKLEKLVLDQREVQLRLLEASSGKQRSKAHQVSLSQNLQEIARSLEDLHQEHAHRFNFLKSNEPDVFKAVLWLRQNEKLFKKKIYEPILTLINISNPQAVKYIENHIAYRDLTAFFSEDPDDMNKFLGILSDSQGLDISGIHAVYVPNSQFRPRVPSDLLRQFGLNCYLKDLFSAPPPVMNYLCKSYKVHDIPVGEEYSLNKIKTILGNRSFPFTKFYLGDFVFRIKTSKYGDHSKSSTSQKIANTGLLRGSVDTVAVAAVEANRKEVENALRNQEEIYSAHSQNESNCTAQLEKLREEKKALLDKREMLKNSWARIQSTNQQIKVFQIPVCSIEEERFRLSCFINDSIQEKIKIFGGLKLLYKELFVSEKQKVLKCFGHHFLLKKKDEYERNLRDASAELRSIKQLLEDIEVDVKRLKSLMHVASENLKKAVGLNSLIEIPEELKSKLDEELQGLPNDITELEREIARQKTKLECMSTINPTVINDFNKRQKQITQTKGNITEMENQLKSLEENIKTIKDRWLPAIEKLIDQISVNFSRYFASLGCAGEVLLDKTDNENDFDKYGISIRVKFRNSEPLSQLSHAHHSGGECSLSTILFMLSLQELTEVPFRCVDEINQGMDNVNERSVFRLIVESSCSKKMSQYFLITPKLLQGLEYPPEMNVMIVHNGSLKKCDWDIDKFLRIKSSLK